MNAIQCVVAIAGLLSILNLPAAAQPVPSSPVRDHIEAMRHLRLGQEYMHAEHWDKAETEFKAAAKLEPTLEMAHYGLGQVYMNTKRFPAAVAAYLGCRDAFVANTARLATNDLAARRQLDDQIRILEDEKTLMATGRVRAMLSGGPAELDRRIAEMRSARFHDEKSVPGIPAWISIALGSAYFRSGAMADAEREYRAALAVDPRLGEGHNNLAVVCLLTGRYPEADEHIRAAENAGFKVNRQLKEDLKNARARP
jgi:tetratricopeptide (TPR) repeat protein